MDQLIHQILSGLATGGIYASVALALVMIYQATHLVNFAQGEIAMFATYIAWTLIQAGMPYWAAFFLTVMIAFVMGVLIERIIVRPVEQAPVSITSFPTTGYCGPSPTSISLSNVGIHRCRRSGKRCFATWLFAPSSPINTFAW